MATKKRAELTWREAIVQVLNESSEALQYTDIADQIITRGLKKSVGATPAMTVAAQLSGMAKELGKDCPFERVSRGFYISRTPALKGKGKKGTKAKTEELTEELDEVKISVVTSFGMFWNRHFVEWKTTPKLLGMQQLGAAPVDFSGQIGIYLLHDGREVIYVGRTTDRPLGRRLYEHTCDRHAGRWDRFSWFGFLPISEEGTIGKLPESIPSEQLLPAFEAILVEAIEPRQNRKRGDDMRASEYLQIEDPQVKRKKQLEVIESLLQK